MPLTFAKISSQIPVVNYLATTISSHLLVGRQVLWLVPGGSSIMVAAAVSRRLVGTDLSNLTVTLTDERYGPVGHDDSNWRQLADAGFKLRGARLQPVLIGQSLEETVKAFAATLEDAFSACDYRLGFFGIGSDGHTAGILPGSPVTAATKTAAGYNAGNFTRVTMTPPAIGRLDEAVVYAVGEAKWPVLDGLEQTQPLNIQPAQALKQVKKLTIFNDHVGEVA